ncbi:hypothetical protein TNCV_4799611 [Trichonephila clavipes]|uniref:Uncharacterized protein n=1 Tax=Trichonephila clavipes TaxID=2585209 RepID=A0A8X6RLB6_TRICX|nr:hypothetical protein TNCV_4799611 [Trichonephila clavipes]
MRVNMSSDSIELVDKDDSFLKKIVTGTSIISRCDQNRFQGLALLLPIHEVATVAKSDEAHFWLNGYVNKQNCRISSEANPQVYVEIPLRPEKLTVWCALWAGGILLQKR